MFLVLLSKKSAGTRKTVDNNDKNSNDTGIDIHKQIQLISHASTGQKKIRTMDGFFMEDQYPITDIVFGKALRIARVGNHLSLISASRMLGITIMQLSALELGRRYEFATDDDKTLAYAIISGNIKR